MGVLRPGDDWNRPRSLSIDAADDHDERKHHRDPGQPPPDAALSEQGGEQADLQLVALELRTQRIALDLHVQLELMRETLRIRFSSLRSARFFVLPTSLEPAHAKSMSCVSIVTATKRTTSLFFCR
jgi:hypothetical protein